MKIKLLFIVVIILVFSACSKKQYNTVYEETESVLTTKSEVTLEQAKENVLSWCKKNYYLYNLVYKNQCSIKLVTEDKVYGKDCYLLEMFLEGTQFRFFAVDKENGEIYLECNMIDVMPLKDIKILDESKYDKRAKSFLGKNINDLIYIDAIEKKGVRYFVYSKCYKEKMLFYDVYLVNMETEETFLWDWETNTLSKANIKLTAEVTSANKKRIEAKFINKSKRKAAFGGEFILKKYNGRGMWEKVPFKNNSIVFPKTRTVDSESSETYTIEVSEYYTNLAKGIYKMTFENGSAIFKIK